MVFRFETLFQENTVHSTIADLPGLHLHDEFAAPQPGETIHFLLIIATDHSGLRKTKIALHRVPLLKSQAEVEAQIEQVAVKTGLSFVPNPDRQGSWTGMDLNGGWDYDLYAVETKED